MLQLDLADALANEGFRAFYDAQMSDPSAGGPWTVTDLLDEIESQIGLDVREIDTVTAFGSVTPGRQADPWAAVLETEWSTDAVRSAVSEVPEETSERTYEGRTVFQGSAVFESIWLALLDGGRVAFGRRSAVTDVVDLATGDGETVQGPVRDTFEAAGGSTFLRFAFAVPEWMRGGESGPTVVGTPLAQLTRGRGLVARGGDQELRVTLETTGGDAARDLESTIDGGIEVLRSYHEQLTAQRPELADRLEPIVEGASVERSKATVEASAPKGLSIAITAFGGTLASFVLGLSSSSDPPRPVASFDWDYDSGDRTLEITHTAGNSIPAASLEVRGEADGGDTGGWDELGGSASGEADGRPAVVSGDSVTVSGVGPAYELDLVYVPSEDNTSTVLAHDEGPEA